MENQVAQQTTTESKFKFPSEIIDLPSKGILYSGDNPLSTGKVEMKYMTAREEDILTNQNYIRQGIVIDKLLQSLLVGDVKYDDLLVGDKNAIMIAARVLAYGKDYTFNYDGIEHEVDLSEVESKYFNESLIAKGRNEFDFTLPHSKNTLTFKLLTHVDENKIDKEIEGMKKLNKATSGTIRLKHTILSMNGDYERKSIRDFVDTQLLARDARALRKYINEIQPGIDMNVNIEFKDGYVEESVYMPIGINFFWPDAEL